MKISIQDSDNTKQLEGGFIELTDANNKVIKVNLDDITDASTVLSNDSEIIKDSTISNTVFAASIVDSEGEILDEENLILDVKSGVVAALDVTFEATHSGGNSNSTVYSSDSMQEDSKTWQFPFAKPLIKNHNMYTEPIGRVLDANFAQSEFAPDRDTINVTFRVSDNDAMEKFADGRYKTMSIGARAGHIVCNVCGKDILKDNKFKFCGHWRGEQYASQTATWTAKKLEYKEGSVVNNPADAFAQVKRIRVIKLKDGSNMTKKEDNQDSTLDPLSITDSLVVDANNETKNVTDAQATGEGNDVANDNPEVQANIGDEETVEEKLAKAEARISDLEGSVNTLTEEKKSLSEKLEAKDNEIKSLKDSNEDVSSKFETLKDQAKALANFNKQLLIDNLKAVNNSVTDEELGGKTAKEISDMLKEAKEKTSIRGMVPALNNPGAAINDNNTIADNGDGESNEESSATMKDFEEVLEGFFTRY